MFLWDFVNHHLRLVFICRENHRLSGILLFPDRPRFCRLMKTSPIVWNCRGLIWRIGSVSIFPARPRFLRWSAIIPDKWNLKFVPSGTSARISGLYASDFAHYQSSKLLGSSPPITDKHGVSETMSDISATSCTVGKKLNPRSPGIFPTYENQA